ncbi:Lsr2 dimerization domain-containing protein [Clavibacter michiganensis]|uniref:Lsr2 dimerization domain-containing protein n=1 Tax=Clavibacter michiganensis TaxID=28447 RepID=UPI00345CC6DD
MDRKAILTADDDPHSKPIEEGEGQSLPFALEGVNYEIDLNDENAPKLQAAFEQYTEKGRRSGPATTAKTATRRSPASHPKEEPSAALE